MSRYGAIVNRVVCWLLFGLLPCVVMIGCRAGDACSTAPEEVCDMCCNREGDRFGVEAPVATEAEVVAALEVDGYVNGSFLLEQVEGSKGRRGGYRIRVASEVKLVSLALPESSGSQFECIWSRHDEEEQSVWVSVEGRVERIRMYNGGAFDSFSPNLYQMMPSRDPWGRVVELRLLGWHCGPRFVFREVDEGFGKGR